MNNILYLAMKYKARGIYIRSAGNSYYAYRLRSKWDKERKKTKTLPPAYIGIATHNGIIRKDQSTRIKSDYEYGNIALLYGIVDKIIISVLKDIYTYMWERIISYVILRNIQPLPMKLVRYL